MATKLALALLAAFVGAGCASHHRLGLQLPPGGRATVRVMGAAATLRIANSGPGDLQVQVTDAAGTTDTTNLGPGCQARTLRGSNSVLLVAGGAEATAVVQAKACDGVELVRPTLTPHTNQR